MPQLGPAEVLVILVVALLVFGPKRLPEVGRQVGRGLKELRKLQDTVRDEINDVLHHDEDEPPRYTAPSPVPGRAPEVGSGQHAPSRYRTAPAAIVAASSAPAAASSPAPAAPRGSDAPIGTPARPAHAPSRFRAPGR
jgi:TatA/E family protein of Tat protein translocase